MSKESIKVKTIDVTAKEWFDGRNGNSYFSGLISINYGMDDAATLRMPFQYGYGDHYIDIAKRELVKAGFIKADKLTALWKYCDDNNIILRTQKYENCLEKDVVSFGYREKQ